MTPSHNGPRGADKATRFTLHRGGRLATVAFERTSSRPRAQVGGGLRGKIAGFSAGSRRRLLRRLASVNKLAYKTPPAFLTLTYPREYPDDPATYRGHARAFLKRLRRKYGDRPVIWRLEFQRRGAPHFHMLVFDLGTGADVGDWIRESWFEVVGSGDDRHAVHGIDLQAMTDWRRVAVYLSKYIAKQADEDGEVHEPVGRWWGMESGRLLAVEPISFVTSMRQGLKVRRAMQKAAGMRRPGGQGDRGTSTFLSDDTAVRLILFYGGRFERPPPHQPDEDHDLRPPAPSVGDSWRSHRHAYIDATLGVSCRLK